jgi:hypothetical protein
MSDELRSRFYETALSAGIPILSGDKCCRILAWLYVYGGGNEQVIEGRLNAAIQYAQKRLNLLGGEIPDLELLPILQGYIKSIADYHNPPEWVNELEAEYKIKSYHKKLFGGSN